VKGNLLAVSKVGRDECEVGCEDRRLRADELCSERKGRIVLYDSFKRTITKADDPRPRDTGTGRANVYRVGSRDCVPIVRFGRVADEQSSPIHREGVRSETKRIDTRKR
jgi:hypothetical protein